MKRFNHLCAAFLAALITLTAASPGPALAESAPKSAPATPAVPASPDEVADYARREQAAPAELAKFRGGDVIITTTAIIVILLVVILLLLI